MTVNRAHFQQLAEERADDAEALILASCWSGAYYLAGYAAECGLKACIAKLTNAEDFRDKNFAASCYTHIIEDLVRLAGVKNQRDIDSSTNLALKANWSTVKDWEEKARYQSWTELQAKTLLAAVSDSVNGVLPWIKAHW